jgi:phage tail-like protein
MPLVGDIWEGYKSSEFVLMVGAVESPSVTRVTGLSEGSFDTIEQPDGGSYRVRKLSGSKLKHDMVTVTRRVDGSADDQLFLDWWKETFDFSQGRSQGSRVRRNMSIIKRDNGVDVMTFFLYDAWVKSSKFSDLEAGSDSLFTQTIEIEHEGFERVPA